MVRNRVRTWGGIAAVAAAAVLTWALLVRERGDGPPPVASPRAEAPQPPTPQPARPQLAASSVAASAPGDGAPADATPWTVTVRVVDATGAPAPDVEVVATWRSPMDRGGPRAPADAAWWAAAGDRALAALEGAPAPAVRARGRTDGGGRVRLAGRGRGQYDVAAVPDAPWLGTVEHVALGDEGPPPSITLHLVAGHEVLGRVVDTQGQGVHAELTPAVRAAGPPPHRAAWRSGPRRTAPDGTFRFSAPAGRLTLQIVLPGRMALSRGPFDVPSGTPLEVVVPALAGSLQVQVDDEDGAPAVVRGRLTLPAVGSGTWFVQVLRHGTTQPAGPHGEVQVQADGTFLLADLPQGIVVDLWIVNRESDFHGRAQEITPGGPEVRIALLRGGSITGRVEGLAPGDGRLRWLAARGEHGFESGARIAEDGTFHLRGLPPGRYGLRRPGGGDLATDVTPGTTGLVLRAEDAGR